MDTNMAAGLLLENYGLKADMVQRAGEGVGGDTFIVTAGEGKFVLKIPEESSLNDPEQEVRLCAHLREKGLPVCRFLPDKAGRYLTLTASGQRAHLQVWYLGKVYAYHTAPDWLPERGAALLGKIHRALEDYEGLSEGIGEGFFRYMSPDNALLSYENSSQIAREQGDRQAQEDLRFRMELCRRLERYAFSPEKVSCRATHGDYTLSQLICSEKDIYAVIDWTTACIHPAVWELFRFFAYACPECREGQIPEGRLAECVNSYCHQIALTKQDLREMVPLMRYQLAVCDYYGQYYGSDAPNRQLFLQQARFSSAWLRTLDRRGEQITDFLLRHCG